MTVGQDLDRVHQLYSRRINLQTRRINDLETRIKRLELLIQGDAPISQTFFDPTSFDGING